MLLHGVKSRTRLYRVFYALFWPILPLLKRFPKYVTTTEKLGQAMLTAAKHGAPKPVLESLDINRLWAGAMQSRGLTLQVRARPRRELTTNARKSVP